MPRNGEKWDFHGAQGGRGNPTTAKSRQNKHKICLRKKLVDAVKFLYHTRQLLLHVNDWKKYMLLMVEKHHVCVILEKS